MNRLELTPWQRRQLRRQLHQTRDARVYRRTLALLEYSRGRSVTDTAALLEVTRQSVHNWIAAYSRARHPSVLFDAPRSGGPNLWLPERKALLLSLLSSPADQLGYAAVNWTVPLLQEQITRQVGRRLSEDTIRRELQRQHYVWKRYRYVLDPDPDKEKKTLSEAASAQIAIHARTADRG